MPAVDRSLARTPLDRGVAVLVHARGDVATATVDVDAGGRTMRVIACGANDSVVLGSSVPVTVNAADVFLFGDADQLTELGKRLRTYAGTVQLRANKYRAEARRLRGKP